MSGERAGRVQLLEVMSHSTPIILGLLVLVGMTSSELTLSLRSLVLALPIPIGLMIGTLAYYRFSHEIVRYDLKGFTLTKGSRVSRSYQWSQFAEVSLFVNPKEGVLLRLYFQPEGEYVELPATKIGLDPFVLRKSLQNKTNKK